MNSYHEKRWGSFTGSCRKMDELTPFPSKLCAIASSWVATTWSSSDTAIIVSCTFKGTSNIDFAPPQRFWVVHWSGKIWNNIFHFSVFNLKRLFQIKKIRNATINGKFQGGGKVKIVWIPECMPKFGEKTLRIASWGSEQKW